MTFFSIFWLIELSASNDSDNILPFTIILSSSVACFLAQKIFLSPFKFNFLLQNQFAHVWISINFPFSELIIRNRFQKFLCVRINILSTRKLMYVDQTI